MAWVGKLALEEEARLKTGCASAKLVDLRSLALAPAVFEAGQFHPVSGRWIEMVKVDRCGAAVTENLLLTARRGKQPEVFTLLPGTSQAGPQLQEDAYSHATNVASQSVPKGCKDAGVVIDSAFDKRVEPDRRDANGAMIGGKWTEIWTARLCGKNVRVRMTFSADGKGGTTFTASAVD